MSIVREVIWLRYGSLGGENKRHDQSVEGQRLPENQDQNHSHENLVLLGICTHACISNDSDCQSCSLDNPIDTSELKPQQSPEARWA
jgi:hypothetical protein